MKLSTKGRYAVTAMLDLALHAEQDPVKLVDISNRQGLSLSYLEQLFARLRRRKLVTSYRGPGGGYRLSRDMYQINVAEVVEAVHESIDATRCEGKGDCLRGETCLTHYLWLDLSTQLQNFLSDISLGNLVERNRQENETGAAQALSALEGAG